MLSDAETVASSGIVAATGVLYSVSVSRVDWA